MLFFLLFINPAKHKKNMNHNAGTYVNVQKHYFNTEPPILLKYQSLVSRVN